MSQEIEMKSSSSAVWILATFAVSAVALEPRDVRDIALFYLEPGSPSFRIDQVKEGLFRTISYLDTGGNVKDSLFDSVVLYDAVDLAIANDPSPEKAERYIQALFDGGVLQALSEAAVEFSARTGRELIVNVFLTAPYVPGSPDPGAYTQRLIDRWHTAAYRNLALVGFYWGYQESLYPNLCDPVQSNMVPYSDLEMVAATAHRSGYRMLWIRSCLRGGRGTGESSDSIG
jgi:hypothetical protein